MRLRLSLEQIYTGVTINVKIERLEKSLKDSSSVCTQCNGSGEVRKVQRSMLGQIINVQPCYHCEGIGRIGGRDKKMVKIDVKIPAGVAHGQYLTSKYNIKSAWRFIDFH